MQHTLRTRSLSYCAILTLAALPCATAHAQEGIVYSPATGDYTISYPAYNEDTGNYDAGLSETTFIPATKIAPVIRSSFRLAHKDRIAYRYAVANGKTAKAAITSISLRDIPNLIAGEMRDRLDMTRAEFAVIHSAIVRAMSAPPGWNSGTTRDYDNVAISNIYWDAESLRWVNSIPKKLDKYGIQPGSEVSGFGFTSLDLPGIIQAELTGGGSGSVYADEGPDEESAIYAQLEQIRNNDFVPRAAAVPMIAVPVPFDATVVLDRIQAHLKTWVDMPAIGYSGDPHLQQKIFLIDASYAAQLGRHLSAAADAYRRNQTRTGKEYIETVREMLEDEHKDLEHDDGENERAGKNKEHSTSRRALIDRLAARVLDFDLKYVLERMDKD